MKHSSRATYVLCLLSEEDSVSKSHHEVRHVEVGQLACSLLLLLRFEAVT